MAIFIPAGGSLMVRGGPVFWNAPIRRAHAAGNIPFVGSASFPVLADRMYSLGTALRASASLDCVSIFFDHGGDITFPVRLFLAYNRATLFTAHVAVQCFVNNVLTLTNTHTQHHATAGLDFNVVEWNVSLTLSALPPNAHVLFRITLSSNVSNNFNIGLRIGTITSSLLGILAHRDIATIIAIPTVGVFSAPPPPSPANVGERPALPIRTVSPMLPIAQRAMFA